MTEFDMPVRGPPINRVSRIVSGVIRRWATRACPTARWMNQNLVILSSQGSYKK